jgi:hypothetical protein
MKLTNVGVVITQRELSLAQKTKVSVCIGKPEPFPDGNGYYCPYQIIGLGDQKVQYAGGEDTVQALTLALKSVGALLYTSAEAKTGLLSWNDGGDLGFPVPDSIRDLAPP